MLYSFDVFDTLITRRVATPKGIFALMQETLLSAPEYQEISGYIRNNFFELRINSEALARNNYQRCGVEDINLEQIYTALKSTGCISAAEKKLLIDLEEQTEIVNSVGIKDNISALKNLLRQGKKVVLVSDMYLSERIIRQMLVKADSIFEKIPLYVSSEYKKSKFIGSLYEMVKKVEQEDYDEWEHCGDNVHSDIEVASRYGIKAVKPPTYTNLLPIEKHILEGKENDAGLQKICGISRLGRWEKGWVSGPESIGCSVAAPILLPYAQWILAESMRRGINRLYFIARDGYIPKLLADILIVKWHLPVKTYYIYGSRRAWRLPSYDGKKGSLRLLLSWSYSSKITTIDSFAKYLQVEISGLFSFLPKKYQNAQAKISHLTLSALVRDLDDNPQFREWLFSQQQKQRVLVERYLQQEINVSDDSFAFVDLGGGGLTQSCLAELMRKFYSGRIRTFFFKLDRVKLRDNCDYYNFLPSFLSHHLIIEMICRAAHGQTEGYIENDNGVVKPILKEGEGEAIIAHGYKKYIEGIRVFAEKYASLNCESTVDVAILLNYMKYVTLSPDKELLDFLADMPNSVSGREKIIYGFAPRLEKADLRELFLIHGNNLAAYYKGTDMEYSFLRLSELNKRRLARYRNNRWQILSRYERLFGKNLVDLTKQQFAGIGDWVKDNVIVYGAGKFGKELYELLNTEGVHIAGWFDKNFTELKAKGMPVCGTITDIKKYSFDYVVIGIKNYHIAQDVKQQLLEMGIKQEKIVYPYSMVDFLQN